MGQFPKVRMEAAQLIQKYWHVRQPSTKRRLDDSTSMGMDVSIEGGSTYRDQSTKGKKNCNDGPRYGKVVTLVETYAVCVKHPIHQLTWAILVALNLYCKGYDVDNAVSEAPAPDNPFYMYLDE